MNAYRERPRMRGGRSSRISVISETIDVKVPMRTVCKQCVHIGEFAWIASLGSETWARRGEIPLDTPLAG
jgi:hypothetical protein